MKAIKQSKYGNPDVLKLIEVNKPIPKDHEMLIKVRAATVTQGDILMRSSKFPILFWLPVRLMFGLFKPRKKFPGCELAGEIEAVGKEVKEFKRGDLICGTTTGLKYGSYAEYVCLPEEWKQGMVVKKPTNLDIEEAAAFPVGSLTAYQILKKGKIQEGQKVLIYGASGSVGTSAIQLAKYFGANVTGVCSTSNLDMVKSLGANEVIDYTSEDFTKKGKIYDIVFDAVGKASSSQCKAILKNKGIYINIMSMTKENNEDLKFLKKLVENDQLRPVIDRSYPLEKISDAHRYVDKGHKKGNVLITINHNITDLKN